MARFPLDTILRWMGSKVPTSLMRLEDVSQVTVLLDASAEDAAAAEKKVRDWFARKGIQLIVVPVFEKKCIRAYRKTQVLLSLVPGSDWRLEYVVSRSRACFKIGRTQLPGGLFDLVVSDPEGTHFPQTEVFARMAELMEGLK